jgi:hypothetical protein
MLAIVQFPTSSNELERRDESNSILLVFLLSDPRAQIIDVVADGAPNSDAWDLPPVRKRPQEARRNAEQSRGLRSVH